MSSVFCIISVELIDRGANVRGDDGGEEDLAFAEHVRQTGIMQPVCVAHRGSRYELRYGFRRFAAALAAGLTEIPCLIVSDEMAQTDTVVPQLVENLQRRDLNPADVSVAVAGLIDTGGLSGKDVATKLGKSPSMVTRWHTIGRGPAEILEKLRKKQITVLTAYRLCQEAAGLCSPKQPKPTKKADPSSPTRVARKASRCVIPIGRDCTLVLSNGLRSIPEVLAMLTTFVEHTRESLAVHSPDVQPMPIPDAPG